MRLIGVIILSTFPFWCFSQSNSKAIEQAIDSLMCYNYTGAFNILKKAASINNLTAQYLLAECYENGIGVDVDFEQSFLLYRKAAERGLPQAMLRLSRCYTNGIGVEIDKDRAYQWKERYNQRKDLPKIPDLVSLCQSIGKGNDKIVVSNSEKDTEIKQSAQNFINTTDVSILKQNTTEKTLQNDISDVDVNIPSCDNENENIFAFIIANENYQEVSSVPNALNDGEIFKVYCNKVLGLPESNIHFVKNATLNNIKRELNLMKMISDAYNGELSFMFYYAGHGFPDEKNKNPHLVPVDGYPSDISTCIPLKDLYELFGSLKASQIVVFLDACFSGASRNNDMIVSARGIAIKPKLNYPTGNTIVFCSSQSDETSFSYKEHNHGLFTYFLLKKLKESGGNVSLGEIVEYVTENVSKRSIVINGKSQTPVINPSGSVLDWKNWKLK